MALADDVFSEALRPWRARLSEKEQKEFESTTLDDLKTTIVDAQKRLELNKEHPGMIRLRKFMEAMEQFGKVAEVFGNASKYVAFIWGPMKLIIQVSLLLGRCICVKAVLMVVL
jgi:hypothetical protein